MDNKLKGRLHTSRLQTSLAGAVLFAGLGLVATSADATLTAQVGGVPSGAAVYETFNSIPLGSAGGVTSGITVSFGNDGQAVQGANGQYAAPYLSNNQGMNFGGQADGADTSIYLSTGSTGTNPNANVTLAFLTPQKYFGLLWGSVDLYNTLTFYNGVNEVGSFTGSDVTAMANGNQGANGTYYVNIDLSDSFDRVVATSSQYAFEIDNVAVNVNKLQFSVPEPGTTGVFLLGLLLVGSASWFKRRRIS